jgi:hypothetical protein
MYEHELLFRWLALSTNWNANRPVSKECLRLVALRYTPSITVVYVATNYRKLPPTEPRRRRHHVSTRCETEATWRSEVTHALTRANDGRKCFRLLRLIDLLCFCDPNFRPPSGQRNIFPRPGPPRVRIDWVDEMT